MERTRKLLVTLPRVCVVSSNCRARGIGEVRRGSCYGMKP